MKRGEDPDLIAMVGDNTSQKVILTFKATVQADFTIPNSVRTVLGFNSEIIPNPQQPADGWTETADFVASFNDTNSFAIRSDLVSGGVPVNNNGLSLLAVIPIVASVGSQNNYAPNNPIKVDMRELRGKTKSNFFLQIVNDKGDYLPQSEVWSCLVVFR